MAYRAPMVLTLAVAAVLLAGCAGQSAHGQPKVYRPLLAHLNDNDVVAPRAPPAALSEPVQLRRGYIRVRPYWNWNGRDFVAVPGEWIKERTDYRYSDAYWERHADGWHLRPAAWYPL